MAKPPPLELICLGPPTARVAGGAPAADVLWRKHLALLAHLALSPDRTRTREHLLGLLWPEKEQEAARHSLSEALRRLRGGLGAARLVADGDHLTLSDDRLTVDAVAFESESDESRALMLYRGEFLEGLSLDDAPAFDDWVASQRARYRSRAAALSVANGERSLAAGAFREAAELAMRARDLDGLAEPPVRLLMRSRALGGDGAGALAAFHDFAAHLDRELGERPGRDVAALAERIRQGAWRSVSRSAEPDEPPLVGRGPTHAAVFEALADWGGGALRTIVVSGGPGMGKTRLVTECLRRAGLEGAVTAFARPQAADQDRAFSTLGQWLRDGLGQAPGAVATEPDSLGTLASLDPALAARVAPRPPQSVAQVAAALAALLSAVSDESPLALALDDAHLADSASLAALAGALRSVRGLPVLLALATSDDTEALPTELLALVRDVGEAIGGVVVRLPPLDVREAAELVRSLLPDAPDEQVQRLGRRLAFETGGSPFWAVTLVRALRNSSTVRADVMEWPPRSHTYEAPLPSHVPGIVRLAAVSRLSQLSDSARAVVAAAAAAGVPCTAAVLAEAAGLPPDETDRALDELERASLLVLEGQRWAFAAPVLGAVVRDACLRRSERGRLRERLVKALESSGESLDDRVRAVELRAALGPSRDALDAALDVTRAALAADAHRAARRALRASEALAPVDDAGAQAVLAELARAIEGGTGVRG